MAVDNMSSNRKKGFKIPRMFRKSREELKCGEDMLYGTEEYNQNYSEYIRGTEGKYFTV